MFSISAKKIFQTLFFDSKMSFVHLYFSSKRLFLNQKVTAPTVRIFPKRTSLMPTKVMVGLQHVTTLPTMKLWWCLFILFTIHTGALERCSDETGGGFCPTGNTCCRKKGGGPAGCIPSDLGALNATCCEDQLTGCGVNYVCGADQTTCIAKPGNTDPLVQTLPRYQLCSAPNLQAIYGLGDGAIKPAYYSTAGDLAIPNTSFQKIRQVIVAVHGASRNADDYFCAMHSTVETQTHRSAKEILVIAPRFAAESDERFSLHNGGTPMRWNEGSWRYGLESSTSQTSSFSVLDDMIRLLSNSTQFPSPTRIRVIGHSAGGQFVQRWSLLTNVWKEHPSVRAIVVNPSSYAYLTPLRKLPSNQQWQIPSRSKCPQYNSWEWGLETNHESPRYVRRVLQKWSVEQLIARFATRDVVYLAGDRDICNVPGEYTNGWCFSHGLETMCMDLLEGNNRLQRHIQYFESLGLVNITSHRRSLVPGVGHDHSLIFHSPVTRTFLFDKDFLESSYAEWTSLVIPCLTTVRPLRH